MPATKPATQAETSEQGQPEGQTPADTTKIRIGKKGIEIVEDKEGTSIRVEDIKKEDTGNWDTDEEEEWEKDKEKNNDFKGHWGGIGLGLNNYLNKDFAMSVPNADGYMDLNTGKSININLNFIP
ncbi:MAG: hypothetical protein HC896_13675, partial [Bacteroidales bacterium]|nr:hypothetical protein [Bacteroidales bacterium]